MVEYYQFVPDSEEDKMHEIQRHVVKHLASVISPDDDPEHAPDVEVTLSLERGIRESDGAHGYYVYGRVDAEPNAPYLRPDFDPEDDVEGNPLSVPSILDEGVEVKNVRSKNA